MSYTDQQKRVHLLNLIVYRETQTDTQAQVNNHHFKWITNFSLMAHNVDRLANHGGRLRWKIENEGFNVQKNSDLKPEHTYSHGPMARTVFYLLL